MFELEKVFASLNNVFSTNTPRCSVGISNDPIFFARCFVGSPSNNWRNVAWGSITTGFQVLSLILNKTTYNTTRERGSTSRNVIIGINHTIFKNFFLNPLHTHIRQEIALANPCFLLAFLITTATLNLRFIRRALFLDQAIVLSKEAIKDGPSPSTTLSHIVA